jgi:hypothetical protein
MQVLCNARVILTVVVCFYLHFFADAKFKCTITVYKHPPGNSCKILMHLSMLCPQGGRPGIPSGFAQNFLPQVGIFTILRSPRVGTFDTS